ncbi:replication factor C subunit 5-like [Triticum dicoccoides]|uniref:replication factor C subunit 5-like n=1 Tax=Triticum dicoccoides TaxID=85692 RepID=UPI00188F2B8C|nr:replication factor C subunit 5-like [Triticum dicoccoides]
MATETPTASPTASPTARTLSAAFADDRRREAVPAGLVKLMLHRWGAACLPKSRAALSARARAATPPPQTQTRPSSASTPPAAQVPARQGHAGAANVSARRSCHCSCIQVIEHGCNHFIFEGGQAVGKRSMVLALLREAFGPDNLQVQEHSKRIQLKGEIARHIDVKLKISGHHVEVNLADLHGYENHVITTLVNESIRPPHSICDHTNCKVIVVHDADRLSSDVQHYIGCFLGRYAGCNKIIFCCSDSSNLEAVKHLCKVVMLQPPSFDEMIKVLEFIAMKEGVDLPRGIASRIAVRAGNNLRQAIRSFEATWRAKYPFVEDRPILTGWEEEIYNVAKKIMEEPSPKQLYLIRGKIRKMIEHNVSPYFIFRHLVTELKRDRDKDFQNSVDELASEFNHKEQVKEYRSRDTTLDISIERFAVEGRDQGEAIQYFIKIEEFTARFMSFSRSFMTKNSSKGDIL